MKREHLKSLLVVVLLVAVGVGCRRMIPVHNFWPTTAVALFAGFFFRSRMVALLTTFVALSLSNLVEPAYDDNWTCCAVYGCLAFSVWLGSLLDNGKLGSGPSPVRLLSASLGCSLLFYVVTNFACWIGGHGMYEHTWSDLMECYNVAIPFFRNTIYGDLFYTAAIFGTYALLTGVELEFPPRRLQPIPVRKK